MCARSGLLRLCTAGSVDDGKSTLIGRLLYESQGVYEDQVRSVVRASRNRVAGPIDFSLFTDGLQAEREQGITIDVAYRYFATARRTFILADTPGHEQYTRNMATGASTADVAVLLVDARHGLRPQSRRHAHIARLLGISRFVVAVNKMDLVEFDRAVFDQISGEFARLLEGGQAHAIPLCALDGDNVTARSARTPWYEGPPLLEYLETIEIDRETADEPFRFPVQLVVRPNHDFRGYAGRILSGTIRPGDAVTAWPSGRRTTIQRIVTWDGDLDVARAPQSITLVLGDEIDVSRGDVIAVGAPHVGTQFEAEMVWMDERPSDPSNVYLLKQTARTVTAEMNQRLALNDIGFVTVTTASPIVFDRYATHRGTGSFILIDPATSFTAAAGMVVNPLREPSRRPDRHTAAARLAHLARSAPTHADATVAVRQALEEMLT